MGVRRFSFSAVFLLAASAVPALGQQNPLATEEHRRLAFLAGQWEEQITYTNAEGQEVKSAGRWVARPTLGLYLQIQYQGTGPQGPYRAFGILTYDRDLGVYRMWWFDDSAGVGEYRGNFTDDDNLVLEYGGKVEGKVFRERIRYTRVAPGEVRTKIEQAWESGEFKPYLEAVAHRTEGLPRLPRPQQQNRPPDR